MKVINKEHPIWQNLLACARKVRFEDLPADIKDMVLIEDESDPEKRYKEAPIYLFGTEGISPFIVYEYDNGFVTYVMGMMDYDLELFATLEEAFEATFTDYFPEGPVGDWNDDGDYEANGGWIIKEVQA